MAKTYAVIVIGAGICGLSTAFHLEQLKVGPIAVCAPSDPPSTSQLSAGYLAGGQFDNYTRVSHAHGDAFARSLWHFGNAAFDAVVGFSAQRGLSLLRRRRIRLIVSEPELTEAKKAVAQLQAAGFTTHLRSPKEDPSLKDRVIAVQDDGERGAYIRPHDILGALAREAQVERLPHEAQALKIEKDGVALTLGDGSLVHAEVAVVAAHLATARFVPALAPALVAVADQWFPLKTAADDKLGAWADGGMVFSANHGYEWGVSLGQGRFHVGGGRYLRKFAGIEAAEARYEERITDHLRGQLAKTFSWGAHTTSGPGQAGLDCRPCDELPIIGPMFGEQRLLVATGFMDQGLTQGFFAGRCLAELIAHGQCSLLPRRLWPERLRSLAT